MLTDEGAKRLMAAVLKRGYDDYTRASGCPEWCPLGDSCETKKIDPNYCTAKSFIHSAWCAALCDGIDIDHAKFVEQALAKGKLSRAAFKHIESELRGYADTKREYESARRDLIDEGARDDGGRSGGVGDPTCTKAQRLADSPRLKRMEAVIAAIETVYAACDKDRRRLIQLKYWEGKYTDEGVAKELYISKATYYRWRQAIICAVGQELGYL